jgi:predicted transcriptional regulator
MNDNVLIDTILEAQVILARHIAGERASAEETNAKLIQLLDSSELVKAHAKRGFSSKALE